MAKKAMVTRTFTCTIAKAMVVDTETAEVVVREFRLFGKFNLSSKKDKNAVNKALSEFLENIHPTLKLVEVKNTTTEDTLYGMDIDTFLNSATKLPPRGTNDGDNHDADPDGNPDTNVVANDANN